MEVAKQIGTFNYFEIPYYHTEFDTELEDIITKNPIHDVNLTKRKLTTYLISLRNIINEMKILYGKLTKTILCDWIDDVQDYNLPTSLQLKLKEKCARHQCRVEF